MPTLYTRNHVITDRKSHHASAPASPTRWLTIANHTDRMLWRLFHTCRINDYLHNDQTWAVVTGSTDGIGKCLADELLSRGFNVLVHGRSPAKLANVVDILRAKHPMRQVDSVLADFNRLEDVHNIPAAIRDKHVTVIINNAAATDRGFYLFHEMPQEQIDLSIHVGVVFLTTLVRETLPILMKNGPSLLINIGSASGEVPCPYIAIYSASKGYLLAFTKCLAAEARMTKSRVEIIYADIHNVNSAGNHTQVNFVTPASEVAARAIINVVGCGYATVTPYWVHEFTKYFTYILPQFLLDKISAASLEAVIKSRTAWEREQSSNLGLKKSHHD